MPPQDFFTVPAYNQAQCQNAMLNALHRPGLALDMPYKLVAANDGSTCLTETIAVGKVTIVDIAPHRQIAASRSAGALVARGDLLIFVDADTQLNVSVVNAPAQAMRRVAVGAGSGKV